MNDSSFFSIDRLVEFGMGMAMAQQMVRVMNDSMQTMYVPGSPNNIPSPQAKPIHVCLDGNAVGPLSEADFSKLVTEHRVVPETLVWTPGMLGWKPLSEVPEVLRIVALAPPPLPNN